MNQDIQAIIAEFEAQADAEAVAGMARYGIVGAKVYGVKIPVLRAIARDLGRNHDLAQHLWAVNSRETRVLATMVDEWRLVTPEQMDIWAADFDSWEICDQACSNLFGRTPYAHAKALAWSDRREEEFVKRAGFVLMAVLAHKKSKTPPEQLLAYLPVIRREASDDRHFVKKAVNWALRDIGKHSLSLNGESIATAKWLLEQPDKTARWIGRDALRELTSDKVQARLSRGPV